MKIRLSNGRVFLYWLRLYRNQFLNSHELERLQFKKLKSVIGHAYRQVRFYRDRYHKAGIHPDDFVRLSDLNKLPVVTKEELRSVALEDLVAANIGLQRCEKTSTSGSSGQPFTVTISRPSRDFIKAYLIRRFLACGLRPWEKMAILSSPRRSITLGQVRSGKTESFLFYRYLYSMSIDHKMEEQVSFLSWLKPASVLGPPSYLRILSRLIRKKGIMAIKPRIIMTWGEVLDGNTRAELEETFDGKVFDGYGSTEVAPIGGLAWECPKHQGLHENSDGVKLEFLRDGEPVSLGERGGVVATSLYRYEMPMIRFSQGDMAVPSRDLCSCGRSFPLIKQIEGRIVDFIVLPDGRLISPYAVCDLMERAGGISGFKVVQESKDRIVIWVERGPRFTQDVLEKVRSELTIAFGDEVTLDLKAVESLPYRVGEKSRYVTSKV